MWLICEHTYNKTMSIRWHSAWLNDQWPGRHTRHTWGTISNNIICNDSVIMLLIMVIILLGTYLFNPCPCPWVLFVNVKCWAFYSNIAFCGSSSIDDRELWWWVDRWMSGWIGGLNDRWLEFCYLRYNNRLMDTFNIKWTGCRKSLGLWSLKPYWRSLLIVVDKGCE